jgi:adenylate kinase family enzyme
MIEKIDILGPSASGKSHLARGISQLFRIPLVSVDTLTRTSIPHVRTPESEVLRAIGEFMATKEWILEGKYMAGDVFDNADMIVWVHRGIVHCLLAQWLRYFSDTEQRTRFGLLSNTKLTRNIVRQHFGLYTAEELLRPRVYTYRKAEQTLSEWPEKVFRVRNPRDEDNLMQRIRDSRR